MFSAQDSVNNNVLESFIIASAGELIRPYIKLKFYNIKLKWSTTALAVGG